MSKLTVLALLVATAGATTTTTEEKLKDGETKCPCLKPGGDSQCNKGDKTKGFHQVCTWLQECHISANASFNFCIKKGNKVCARHQYLGTTGNIVKVQSHDPYKICCDDKACTSKQECIDQEGGTGTFEYEYANSDGATTTMLSWTLADIARNGWRNKKGEKALNKPKVCVDRAHDATVWARAFFAPACAMFFILLITPIMLFTVCKGCHKRPGACQNLTMPIIVIMLSFFLCFGEGWPMALFTMLVAGATIATPADKKWKLVMFQIAYAWMYYGGTNWFFATDKLNNYFVTVSTKTLDEMETACQTYFTGSGTTKYFTILTAYKTWDTDDQAKTWGLCDRYWLDFLISVQYAQALALFLMVTLCLYAYLSPATSCCAYKKGQMAAAAPKETA